MVSINDESQKNKSQYLKVSNFIEEEVVYYEESFPGEFDDGVVVDYEEIPFDEQVPSPLLLFVNFFSEFLLIIGEARFQPDHPGVHLRKVFRR